MDHGPRDLARWLRGSLAGAIHGRKLSEEIVYWRARKLYSEGVAQEGGDPEDEAEIHACEGAQTAIRRLADRRGVPGEALPDSLRAGRLAVHRLHRELEEDEAEARRVLERLGPLADIPLLSRCRDYLEADAAETTLEQAASVRRYLAWLYPEENAASTRGARP